MTNKTFTISAAHGLHARPATEIVKAAKNFSNCKITLTTSVKSVSASSMLGILSLGLKCDTDVQVSAEGEDEEKAIETIGELLTKNWE